MIDARPSGRPRLSSAQAVAALVALFLISGRWSFARILDVEDLIIYQVRFWVVLVLVLLTVVPGQRVRRSADAAGLAFVGFVGYFLASAVWAPDADVALDKGLELLLLAAGTLAIARLCRSVGPRELTRALWPILGVLLAGFALLGLVVGLGGGGRVAVLGGGPNVFGRNMGLLAVVCVAASLVGRKRPGLVVVAIVAGALVLLSGSRGALVATAASLAALFFMQRARLSRALFVLLALGVVAIAVASYTDVGREALEAFEQRVIVLTLEQDYDSGRSALYADALGMGRRSPLLGAGLGGFSARGHGVYPHNIFLEAFAEGGLVGVVLLLAVLGRALVATLSRSPAIAPMDAAAFVLLLVAAQFSGDFYDSRGVFVMAVLLACRPAAGPLTVLAMRRPERPEPGGARSQPRAR